MASGDMTLKQYEEECKRTSPEKASLAVLALGVAGEAGEVADTVKKHLGHGIPLDTQQVLDELGDVLWYVTALAMSVGCSLEEVAEINTEKLRRRYPGGFVEGGGVR